MPVSPPCEDLIHYRVSQDSGMFFVEAIPPPLFTKGTIKPERAVSQDIFQQRNVFLVGASTKRS